MHSSRTVTMSLVAATVGLMLIVATAAAQECTRSAAIISDADVYQSTPRYLTGIGWQGAVIDRLSLGTQVYICREVSVEFGFSARIWLQIGYAAAEGKWRYGWILDDKVRELTGQNRIAPNPESWLMTFTMVPVARAQEAAPENAIDVEPSARPPLPPAENLGLTSQKTTGTTAWRDLGILYGPLFVAMLIGMMAKVVVDCLELSKSKKWNNDKMWEHVKNGVIAILVSPIVFLGLLNAGEFSSSKLTFLVLTLIAFQNGFFWQTVLKKAET